ncbi:hypothetical protein NSQ82_16485 [Caldifermentibacillus hisashii]|uniref:hypothetical protein n=1 Tax=Caldifermentibacillus hisashii TaxID=996558 RepID=UPI0031B69709
MEKTLTIDGKKVRFKSTAATPLRYKAQFGKDFFKEIYKLDALNSAENTADVFEKLDFDFFYNLIWVLAKTANPSIPDPITWLDEFDEFPLMDIIPELQDLLISTIQSKKK